MCFSRISLFLKLKCCLWPWKKNDDSFVSFETEEVVRQEMEPGVDDVLFFNGVNHTDAVVIQSVHPEDDERRMEQRIRRLRILRGMHAMPIYDEEEDMIIDNEGSANDVDRDRLFEEYLRENLEQTSSQAENYNTELPTEHSYLGKMERVEGVDFLEPGKIYRIPICGHHSIVYPGETIPLILSTSLLTVDDADGIKIGLVFWEQVHKNKFYGVTCQVYEKDFRNSVARLKTVAQQRFELIKQKNGTYTRSYRDRYRRIGYYADVLILPEITLPDPLFSISSNSLSKFSKSNSAIQAKKFKEFLSGSTVWPKFVYDQYGMEGVMKKVNRFLAFLKIQAVPNDPVKLSFWLARNIPIISQEDRCNIFFSNTVIDRMLIINKSLDYMCYFVCKRCEVKIGNYNEIFAMSKEGVQASYCNPSGYVHETLTIYKTITNTTYTIDRPSTEFSWFPGYSWQIVQCASCHCHLGWKFVATKKNYLPKSFYGLSGKSINVKSVNNLEEGEEEEDHDDNDDDDDDDDDGHSQDVILEEEQENNVEEQQ